MIRGLLLFAIHFLLYSGLYARVVINEFCYNPEGVDTGKEWIELFNTSSTIIDLTGYSFYVDDDAANQWELSFTITGLIAPEGYFLIEWSEDATPLAADFIPDSWKNMYGASSKLGGVRLYNPVSQDEDIVVYGYPQPNKDNLIWEGSGPAPYAGSGESLSRFPDGKDTDDNQEDFIVLYSPTPMNSNYNQAVEKLIVYPNPFRLHQDNTVNLLPPAGVISVSFRIKIYTLKGSLIREIDTLNWDGKDKKGRDVSPGVYYIIYETERGKARGKITVIR